MEVEFKNTTLSRLGTDVSYDAGYDHAVVRAFRMRLQLIRAAIDERPFYALKSLHFEKLKGDRVGRYSMRLNSQWGLILKFKKKDSGKTAVVISISDYH